MNFMQLHQKHITSIPVLLLAIGCGIDMTCFMVAALILHLIICRVYHTNVLGDMFKSKIYKGSQAVNDFIALTENCEIARYAPSSSTTIQHDFDKAVAIISELEKQI